MREDISITLGARDQRLVADCNTSQKHVWRTRVVLLSADGVGMTPSSSRETEGSKCWIESPWGRLEERQ